MSARSLAAALLVLSGCFDPQSNLPDGEVVDDPTTGGSDESGPANPQTSMGETEPEPEPSDDSTSTTSMPDDDETTSSNDTEPVGPPSCADGNGLCVATPPDWLGPVRPVEVARGEAAECQPVVSASTGLDAPPAVCTCECGDANGASCSEATLAAWGNDGTCSDDDVFSQVVYPPSEEQCNYLPQGVWNETFNYWSLTTESTGGSCTPDASRSLPPLAYATDVHGCSVEALDMECEGGGGCFEAPDDAPLCVWREGEHDCPGEGFSVRTVYHRGVPDDTRDCDDCSCGTPEGSCPSSALEMYIGHYCSSGSDIGIIETCTGLCAGPGCETYGLSAVLEIGPAEASCDASGGGPIGNVTETDPVTFCCSA